MHALLDVVGDLGVQVDARGGAVVNSLGGHGGGATAAWGGSAGAGGRAGAGRVCGSGSTRLGGSSIGVGVGNGSLHQVGILLSKFLDIISESDDAGGALGGRPSVVVVRDHDGQKVMVNSGCSVLM